MIIAKVVGSVVSTIKNDNLEGKKLMIVQPIGLENEKPQGKEMIAIDIVSAGIDDIVLVNREGGSARVYLNNKNIPVQAVIVGVVDKVDLIKE
ncbi:MAG: hypothetical protein DWQ06_00015 [Calditrichaeota bacterium]|nr:MAG: hypothetical protein DWQ06_00015 [Calditrichota bacterium]